jgi:hypothetical protein
MAVRLLTMCSASWPARRLTSSDQAAWSAPDRCHLKVARQVHALAEVLGHGQHADAFTARLRVSFPSPRDLLVLLSTWAGTSPWSSGGF